MLVAGSEQAQCIKAPAVVLTNVVQRLAALRAQCGLSSGCITAPRAPAHVAGTSNTSTKPAKTALRYRRTIIHLKSLERSRCLLRSYVHAGLL